MIGPFCHGDNPFHTVGWLIGCVQSRELDARAHRLPRFILVVSILDMIVSDLQIAKIQEDASNIRSNHDPVLPVINTFQNHPSVANIKQREFNSTFSFRNTNENEVRKIFKNLNVRKTWQGDKLP